MNCKQGDMAVVIRSSAGNHGRTVTCLELIGEGPMVLEHNGRKYMLSEGFWWRVDRDMNLMFGGTIFMPDVAPFALDKYLMPIGSQDAKIESKETEEEPA